MFRAQRTRRGISHPSRGSFAPSGEAPPAAERDAFGQLWGALSCWRLALAVAVMIAALSAVGPAVAAQPEWFPLRGAHEIGCTMNNPSPAGPDSCQDPSGYHSWAALDIDATRSDDVYAAGKGTVHSVIDDQPQNCPRGGCQGNRVTIAHPVSGGTVYSVYLHLSSVAKLTKGQPVTENTVLGKAGDSGPSDPGYVHLHFEIRDRPDARPTSYRNGLPLKACVNGQLRTYPFDAGQSSWSALPRNTVLQADGVGACALPNLVGSQLAAARRQLAARGAAVTVNRVLSPNRPAGVVTAQSPAPGATTVEGPVVLTVSAGQPRFSYISRYRSEAELRIKASGGQSLSVFRKPEPGRVEQAVWNPQGTLLLLQFVTTRQLPPRVSPKREKLGRQLLRDVVGRPVQRGPTAEDLRRGLGAPVLLSGLLAERTDSGSGPFGLRR